MQTSLASSSLASARPIGLTQVTEREGMRALLLNGAFAVHAGIFSWVSTGSRSMWPRPQTVLM
jgi:hypothetical protein